MPYYLAPDGELAFEAFAVIREAMRSAGQVALGRVVISSRERLVALEAKGNGILAHTLRTRDEVNDTAEVFGHIPETQVDPAMLTIARQILAQHAGPFDPAECVDRYGQALRAMIEEKRKDAPLTRAGTVTEGQIGDLMAALKASLAPPAPVKRERRRNAAERPAPASKARQPGKRSARSPAA
jgi:DNA end-binding protein Ku